MAWCKTKLVDVAAKKRWALNGGPFGSKPSRKHYSESGVPVIRGTNLSGSSSFSFDDFVVDFKKIEGRRKAVKGID